MLGKWLHAVAHWLDLHSTFSDTYGDPDGYVYTGRRCATCGTVARGIRMWRIEDSDRALKNLFSR